MFFFFSKPQFTCRRYGMVKKKLSTFARVAFFGRSLHAITQNWNKYDVDPHCLNDYRFCFTFLIAYATMIAVNVISSTSIDVSLRMSTTFSYHFHFEFVFEWLTDDNNSKLGERTYYVVCCMRVFVRINDIFCSLLSFFNSMTRRGANRLTSFFVVAKLNVDFASVKVICTERTLNLYEVAEK